MALCGSHIQSSIDSQGLQFQTHSCFQEASSCRQDTVLAFSSCPEAAPDFCWLACSVIKIMTACKAKLLNVSFSVFWSWGNGLIVTQTGFYYHPLCTLARKNIEEYGMGNTQHQQEGWSRLATTALFPRENFSESNTIEESCLSLCILCMYVP